MRKIIAFVLVCLMALSFAACGAGEETTVTGMVISVEGTKISLVEMDGNMFGGRGAQDRERPQMPEGMEGFGGFGEFDPESFEGTMPQGGNFPQWGSGERPERGEMPEGMTMPEMGEMPEGMTMPDFSGERPDFSDREGGQRPGFGNFAEGMESKEYDLASAHISVEFDGGKASGTMEDIQVGTFVTLTVNGKGQVTNVLVSSQSFFGGGNRWNAG